MDNHHFSFMTKLEKTNIGPNRTSKKCSELVLLVEWRRWTNHSLQKNTNREQTESPQKKASCKKKKKNQKT